MEFDRVSLFGDKISIRIPHDWIEIDLDDKETYTFSDPNSSLGWLRINLFTKKTKELFCEADLRELISNAHDGECGVYKVGEMYVAAWQEDAKHEDNLRMFYWEAGEIIDPQTMRIAAISFAVEQERFKEEGFNDKFEMIQDCVFATSFTSTETA